MAAAVSRSILRSSSFRAGAARVAADRVAGSRPLLRSFSELRPPAATRFLRCPVETSFCAESLMPMHSATASALLTSMLNVSHKGYGWLSEGRVKTR